MKRIVAILFIVFCAQVMVKAQSTEFLRGVELGKKDAKALLDASGSFGHAPNSGVPTFPAPGGGSTGDEPGVVPIAPVGGGGGTTFYWNTPQSRDTYFNYVNDYINNCYALALNGIDVDFNNGKAQGMQLQAGSQIH